MNGGGRNSDARGRRKALTVVQQAKPVLKVQPDALHQRIGLVFGSKNEVERIERYHTQPAEEESTTPLFVERGLFRV